MKNSYKTNDGRLLESLSLLFAERNARCVEVHIYFKYTIRNIKQVGLLGNTPAMRYKSFAKNVTRKYITLNNRKR